MSSGREWRESATEFTIAAGDGIRQCLDLADDLKDDQGECVEAVREQLLAMVKLEREVRHLEAAMQHVEAMTASVQGAESREEAPELVKEMENKLALLMREDECFDPSTHPSALEFTKILTEEVRSDNEEEEEVMDEDVQVGKVQVSLKCPLTGQYLVEPVSNPQCSHTYSKSAVIRHIHIQRRAGSAAKCPVCSGPLHEDRLRSEPGLADKVRRAQRKRVRRPPESIVSLSSHCH